MGEVAEYFVTIASEPGDATKGFVKEASLKVMRQLQEIGDYGGSLRALELYWKVSQTEIVQPWRPK